MTFRQTEHKVQMHSTFSNEDIDLFYSLRKSKVISECENTCRKQVWRRCAVTNRTKDWTRTKRNHAWPCLCVSVQSDRTQNHSTPSFNEEYWCSNGPDWNAMAPHKALTPNFALHFLWVFKIDHCWFEVTAWPVDDREPVCSIADARAVLDVDSAKIHTCTLDFLACLEQI